MNNYIKNLVIIATVMMFLIACKSISNIDDFEFSDTEYNVDDNNNMSLDTIPDPNPEEPEIPEEEPEEEPEEPEEEPDPIPDTIGIWRIK